MAAMTLFGGRNTLVGLLVVLAVAQAAAAYYYYALARVQPEAADAEGGRTSTMEVAYAFDPADTRRLVGFATNVFVGRVVGKIGSEGAALSGPGNESVPRTQFSVKVLENIEGKLSGTVTVSQTGGYDRAKNHMVLVEGDPPLEKGQEYLFATRLDREEGWYAVAAPPFGDVRLRDARHRAEVVEKFEQAHREEIPFRPSAPAQGPPHRSANPPQ
jgi:hypothetical protein